MFTLTLTPHEPIIAQYAENELTLHIPPQGGDIEVSNYPCLADWRYLVLDITTQADMHLPVRVIFSSGDMSRENSIYMTTSSIPGIRAVMPLDLTWLNNRQVFKGRTPGRMKTTVSGTALEPSDITSLTIHIREFLQPTRIVVHGAYLTRERPDTALKSPFPVVDALGQVAARDWPGKTADEAELFARLTALYKTASASKAKGLPFPERFGFSRWGGDASKRLTQGSGYFAVAREGDTWYLTDPEGYAFFSTGLDCIGTNTAGMLSGIEELYSYLPDRAAYADAYETQTGYFGGDLIELIDFYRVNMIRVFGEDWFDAYCAITEYQVKEMGFNTIGNWSDPAFIARSSMPYVLPLADFPRTQQFIFRDFPDVFSKEYDDNSTAYAEQLKAYAGDARLIGYFMRNEPQWGFSRDINLAREMFRYETPYESKHVLWSYLTDKYGGAEALSAAWGIAIADEAGFMALTMDRLPPDGACEADLRAFGLRMVDRYLAAPALALRAVDPHHLNMGMRYSSITTDAMFAGSQYVDVFSINSYRAKPRAEDVAGILERCGKPCLIGEYHFGAADRGCFGNALRSVADTGQRGIAYRYFTEQSAAMPSMLGCHYFCLGDEAALGRDDGECWMFGFIDVCHRPYEEMYEAAQAAHARIYAVKSGAAQPFSTLALEAPANGY